MLKLYIRCGSRQAGRTLHIAVGLQFLHFMKQFQEWRDKYIQIRVILNNRGIRGNNILLVVYTVEDEDLHGRCGGGIAWRFLKSLYSIRSLCFKILTRSFVPQAWNMSHRVFVTPCRHIQRAEVCQSLVWLNKTGSLLPRRI